jgi:hypothetical protein
VFIPSLADRGALELARSPHLRRLEGLYLVGNRFGDAARAALRERFGTRAILGPDPP